MVRVVGKEGALGTGVGGNCSSGMDGSETITRRYPGRGRVYYSGGFRYIYKYIRSSDMLKNIGTDTQPYPLYALPCTCILR